MDHYSAERWMLERHRDMVRMAERRARLDTNVQPVLRAWMAGRLRSLADRLDGVPRVPASANLTPPRVTG